MWRIYITIMTEIPPPSSSYSPPWPQHWLNATCIKINWPETIIMLFIEGRFYQEAEDNIVEPKRRNRGATSIFCREKVNDFNKYKSNSNNNFFLNFHVISYKIYHTIIHLTSRRQRIIGLSVKIHRLFN